MGEPGGGIFARNGVHGQAHRLHEGLVSAGAQPAQDRLELGERLLDGREVGRVGRQEEQLAAVLC